MNNNIEVIGIDHGWSQMKTSNTCFNTSIKELANAPAFHDNVLDVCVSRSFLSIKKIVLSSEGISISRFRVAL